jgi:hypothetical protein
MPTITGITPKVENEAFTIWSTGKKDIGAAGPLWVEVARGGVKIKAAFTGKNAGRK